MDQLDRLRIRKDGIDPSELACCGHASDCAVHNMPAYPNGPCDCGYEEKMRLRAQLENAIRCCNDPENCDNEADASCPTKLRWKLAALEQKRREDVQKCEQLARGLIVAEKIRAAFPEVFNES